MTDLRKTGEGGMKGWATRRHNGTDSPKQLRAEIERLRGLVQCLLDNDPNDDAADGVTVLDVWRKDARRALEGK